jgi:hypothetical protein
VPLLNGLMVMLGALGAVTATLPADLLLAWIGRRELFGLFAALTAACAVMVHLVVPEAPPIANGAVSVGLRKIYADPAFLAFLRLSRQPASERLGLCKESGRRSGSPTLRASIGQPWCFICLPGRSRSVWVRFCLVSRPIGCVGVVSDQRPFCGLSQPFLSRLS